VPSWLGWQAENPALVSLIVSPLAERSAPGFHQRPRRVTKLGFASEAFVAESPQWDDITLVIMKVKPGSDAAEVQQTHRHVSHTPNGGRQRLAQNQRSYAPRGEEAFRLLCMAPLTKHRFTPRVIASRLASFV
jgi:hypothetical protein